MEDILGVFVLIITLVYFGWILYSVQKFKRESMKQKAIVRKDLILTVWQIVLFSAGIFTIMFAIGLIAGQTFREDYTQFRVPFICLPMMIAFGIFALWAQFALLRNIWGLPIK